MISTIATADGAQYKRLNGVWLQFRVDGSRRVLTDGTHTDPITGHTTTVVGSSLTVVDRDGRRSTVMA